MMHRKWYVLSWMGPWSHGAPRAESKAKAGVEATLRSRKCASPGLAPSLLAWLAPLFALGIAHGCGRVASLGNDSESHFPGVVCLMAVATARAACVGSAPGPARTRPIVRALLCPRPVESSKPLSVAARPRWAQRLSVASTTLACDVSCVADADCSALGPEHRCSSGYCRAGASRLSQDVTSNEPATRSWGPRCGRWQRRHGVATRHHPPSCEALLNQPPRARLTIRVRNERSQPIICRIFLAAQSRIAATRESLVFSGLARMSRHRELGLRTASDARRRSAAVTEARTERAPPVGCLTGGFILEAGAEVSESIDREWFIYPLPLECFSSPPMNYSPETTCIAYGPLVDGPYTLTVQAYTEVEPVNAWPCFYLPDGDNFPVCVTGTPGSALIATASTNTPRGELSLVFRDDVTPADAGEPNGPSPTLDAGSTP